MKLSAVCSRKARPSVHNNHTSHGNQHWKRDVFHITNGLHSFCGLFVGEYIHLDVKVDDKLINDPNLCYNCEKKVKQHSKEFPF